MALDYTPAVVPTVGQVVSVALQMSTFGVVCVCLMRRTPLINNFRNLSLAMCLVLLIYVDSTVFILASSIIVHGLGINSSRSVCEGGIMICLICYMTTKILIYFFLVERAYIVRGFPNPRLKTKLWLFNCLCMMLPYTVFVVMNFVWRITYINDEGVCIIGMQKIAMLPLITFEVVVNIYLTLLFVLPLRKLYSYKHNTNSKLRRMAFRSLIGSLSTLTTSVVNLTVLMVLRGEPGWICLMCCNIDTLFCVVILHWVTSIDKPSVPTSTRRSRSATIEVMHQVRPQRDDMVEFWLEGQRNTDITFWPYELPPSAPQPAKLPGTVTTEIRCGTPKVMVRSKSEAGRVLRKSRVGISECGKDVKLHGIHVQSEVRIGSRRSGSRSECGWTKEAMSLSVEGAWGIEKSISAENMV